MALYPLVIKAWAPTSTPVPLTDNLEDSVPFDGAIVAITAQVINLVLRGELLNRGPEGELPTEDNGSGALVAESMTALQALVATTDGQACTVTGFEAQGDRRGVGTFIFSQGSADELVPGLIEEAVGGRWKRLLDASHRVESSWFGLKGDGSNETALLQAFLNYGATRKACYRLAPGTYGVSDTLRIGPGSLQNALQSIALIGDERANGEYGSSSTQFVWISDDATKPMFVVSGACHSFKGFSITAAANKTLHCGIAITKQFIDASNVFNSAIVFDGVTIGVGNVHDRHILYGVAMGSTPEMNIYNPGNIENCRFSNCSFENCRRAAFVMNAGQPINTVWDRCYFVGYTPPGGGLQRGGIGVLCMTYSASGQFLNCDFQGLGCWLWLQQVSPFSFVGGESEYCVAAVRVAGGPFDSYGAGVTARDMRVTTHSCGVGTYDAYATENSWPETIPVDDAGYFFTYAGSGLLLENNSFAGNPADSSPKFKIVASSGAPVVSLCNAYPNADPFGFFADYTNTVKHGVFSSGDRGEVRPYTGSYVPIPTYQGGLNKPGTVTISGTATEALVAFPVSEIDLSFQLKLDIVSASWGAPSMTAKAVDVSPTGFLVQLSSAPGTNQRVVVNWQTSRNGVVPPSADPIIASGVRSLHRATTCNLSGGSLFSWLPVVPEPFGAGFMGDITGTKCAIPANVAALNNRRAAIFSGTQMYSGDVSGVLTSQTWLIVANITGAGCIAALTLTSIKESGVEVKATGTNITVTRQGGAAVSTPFTTGAAIILVTATSAGASVRVNSISTVATVATSSASLQQGQLQIGGNGLTGAPADSRMAGSIAEIAIWGSVLSGGTITDVMTDRAGYYNITLV